VSAYDLVFESEMKQIHHLLILRTLVSEQVLNCVYIICVPLEFQSLWVSLRPSKIDLVFLTEHAPIKEIVNSLIVDLHKTDINGDFSLSLNPDSIDFL
jgi:hypothetical protein